MTYDPYKLIPAILVAVLDSNKVLLAKRVGTTYMDGWYGLPGGHLEEGETIAEGAARELFEEVDLTVKPEDLELFHIYQNYQKNTGRQYVGFIFRCTKWQGQPFDKEDKVQGTEFFELTNLPEKIIPYHLKALEYSNGPAIDFTYTEHYGVKT